MSPGKTRPKGTDRRIVVSCRSAGSNCEKEIRAPTEQEALQQAAEHARAEHGMQEVTPEVVAKAKSVMRDE